jgi:cytochrome oxidase Cu insertion factor (SCO1/SenC/PrrC family)
VSAPTVLPPVDPALARRARLKLLLIVLACAAPVIASYFTYYVIRPEGRVNYADLIEPQRPTGEMRVRTLDNQEASLAQLRGKWLLVTAAPSECPDDCRDRLFQMRQVRLMTGRERDRVARLWLLTDQGSPSAALIAEHEGLELMRIDPAELATLFQAAPGGEPSRHVFIVDPLGNLMMRFPVSADPAKMKKDLSKLLRASRIG